MKANYVLQDNLDFRGSLKFKFIQHEKDINRSIMYAHAYFCSM
jgi:hypothetical protein